MYHANTRVSCSYLWNSLHLIVPDWDATACFHRVEFNCGCCFDLCDFATSSRCYDILYIVCMRARNFVTFDIVMILYYTMKLNFFFFLFLSVSSSFESNGFSLEARLITEQPRTNFYELALPVREGFFKKTSLRTVKIINVIGLTAHQWWLSDKAYLLNYIRSPNRRARLRYVKAAII